MSAVVIKDNHKKELLKPEVARYGIKSRLLHTGAQDRIASSVPVAVLSVGRIELFSISIGSMASVRNAGAREQCT